MLRSHLLSCLILAVSVTRGWHLPEYGTNPSAPTQPNLCKDVMEYHLPCLRNVTLAIQLLLAPDHHFLSLLDERVTLHAVREMQRMGLYREWLSRKNVSECDDRNKFLKSTWLLTKAHRLGIFTDNLMRKVQSGKTKLKLNLKLFENVEEKVCSAKAVEKIKGSREQVWCIVHKDPRKCNQENPDLTFQNVETIANSEGKNTEDDSSASSPLGHLHKCRDRLGKLQKQWQLIMGKLTHSYTDHNDRLSMSSVHDRILELAKTIIEKKQCDDEETKSEFAAIEEEVRGMVDKHGHRTTTEVPLEYTRKKLASKPLDPLTRCRQIFHGFQKEMEGIPKTDPRVMQYLHKMYKVLHDLAKETTQRNGCDGEAIKAKISAFGKQIRDLSAAIIDQQ